jgi:hypothetical protein
MATYFISNSVGSDSNTSTQAQSQSTPWQTLLHAQTVAADGDNLLLKSGDAWSVSGTATFNVGVNISSYGAGPQPIYTSPSTGYHLIAFTGIDGWSVSNLNLSAPTPSLFTGMSCINCINIDGITRTRPISITNNTISGNWAGVAFGTNAVGLYGYLTGSGTSTQNITVSGNDISCGGAYSILFWHNSAIQPGVYYDSWDNVKIINNNCHNITGAANYPRVLGHIILVAMTSGICDGNTMNYCGSNVGPAGPIFTSTVNNFLIQNNTIGNVFNTKSDGVGVDIDSYSFNVLCQYNFAYNCDDGLVELLTLNPGSGNVFRWNAGINLCRRGTFNGSALLSIRTGSSNGGGYDVYNNTAICCTPGNFGIVSTADNVHIYNNLLMMVNGGSGVNLTTSGSKFHCDGNYYWIAGLPASGASTPTNFRTATAAYKSLLAWQAGTNYDLNSQTPGGFTPFMPMNPVGLTSVTPAQLTTSNLATNISPYVGSPILTGGLNLRLAPYNLDVGNRDFFGNPLGATLPIGAVSVGRTYTTALEQLAQNLQPTFWFRGNESPGSTGIGDSTLWAGAGNYLLPLVVAPPFVSGDPSTVISFVGSTNKATITQQQMTTATNVACSGFSVCAWINLSNITTMTNSIMDSPSGNIFFFVNTNGTLGLNTSDGLNHSRALTVNSGIITLNTPAFIAATCDASGAVTSLYLNGQPQSVTYTTSGATSFLPYNSQLIGSFPSAQFNGKMANLMFFANNLLSPTQIQQLYQAGVAMGYSASVTGQTISVQPYNTVNVDTLTFSDNGAGGTFSPSSTVTYVNSTALNNVTYNNPNKGNYNIFVTSADNGLVLLNPLMVIIGSGGGGNFPFFPVQYNGGPHTIVPATGHALHVLNGGVIFAGGRIRSVPPLTALNYPYLGIPSRHSENLPIDGLNQVTTASANGTFATMIKGRYVILTFSKELAGLHNTILVSPASHNTQSANLSIGWVNTYQINTGGGWWYLNGLPVLPSHTRDNIGKEHFPGSYTIPTRLTTLPGGKLPSQQTTAAKTD